MRYMAFNLSIDRQRVLDSVGCGEDNSLYQELSGKLDRLENEFRSAASPKGAWCWLDLGEDVLHSFAGHEKMIGVLFTLGDQINEVVKRWFATGEYMEGLILDSMASTALFAMDQQILDEIHKECSQWGLTAVKKYAPGDNISLDMQKTIVSLMDVGVQVSQNNVLSPLKSMSYILGIEEGQQGALCTKHSCRDCAMESCMFRNRQAVKKACTVKILNDGTVVNAQFEENLFDLLTRMGYPLENGCGKKGLCGYCKVWVGKEYISACTYKIQQDIEIELPSHIKKEKNENTPDHYYIEKKVSFSEKGKGAFQNPNCADKVGFAVDIGTTTIVVVMMSMENGIVLDTLSFMNGQRAYGADVISRIQSANEGGLATLSNIVKKQLGGAFETLLARNGVGAENVQKIVIACNTAMAYLLLGHACDALGTYPYSADKSIEYSYTAQSIFAGYISFDCNCMITPFISAFVGGDIVAGIYQCSRKSESFLLVDIGTNGEIALYEKGRIVVASTAAGPAFEGGNIKFGAGSVSGAICNVGYSAEEKKFRYKTIHDKKAAGICGSGIIDITAILLVHEFMDRTGLLREPYFTSGVSIAGNIGFYQEDIRQVQMAKAALRSGIEIVLGEAKRLPTHIFIAGGMGHNMNLKNAAIIGLLPENLQEKAAVWGNTALNGAMTLLLSGDIEKDTCKILSNALEIDLSSHPLFQRLYISRMNF